MADTPEKAKPVRSRKSAAGTKAKAAEAAKPEAGTAPAKARFAKAVEEVRAGAQAMAADAQGRAEVYREKAAATGSELLEEAKAKLVEDAKTQPDVQRFVDFLEVSKRGIIR